MSITSSGLNRPDSAVRVHRSHQIVAADGLEGVLRVATALRDGGYRVRDFMAYVREGIVLSDVTCTVSLTAPESDQFLHDLGQVQGVVSVEPC